MAISARPPARRQRRVRAPRYRRLPTLRRGGGVLPRVRLRHRDPRPAGFQARRLPADRGRARLGVLPVVVRHRRHREPQPFRSAPDSGRTRPVGHPGRVRARTVWRSGDQVLLLLRSGTGYKAGRGGQPSGKVEPGESYPEAAVREFGE
ncbi:MAG: NUDIX domain-containing protein [Mycobacteriales bacterium]